MESDPPAQPEQAEKRARLMAFLYRLEREVGSTPDFAEALERAVALAQQATGAGGGGLVLQNEGQWVKVVAPTGKGGPAGDSAPAVRRILGRAMSQWAARRWDDLVVADTQSDPQWKDLAGLAGDVRSVLAISLKHQGQFQGILALTHSRPNYFVQPYVDLMRAAAWGIASALEKSRRYCDLARERSRLEAIVLNLSDALFVVDARGTVVLTNPALERLLGRPGSELRGKSYRQAVPLEHPSHPSPIEQILRGRYASFDLDMVLHRAEKEDIPVRVGGEAIPGEKGRPGGAVVLLRDLRYLKEIEGLREDLTHMLVHDLKGPLTSIGSTVQLLQHYPLARIGEETVRDLLILADRGVSRLTRMIEAVLDVQRLEASQFPLHGGPVHLAEVVGRVVEEIRPAAVENQIEMRVELPEDLPAVLGDREVLERVLWNLLDNALKYTPRDGLIRVAARAAEGASGGQGDLSAGRWVRVEVSDSGTGIPPEDQGRIFGKFAQSRPAPGKRRGVGLGLAFCRLAVEAHGGRIWVESGRPVGSTFVFVLPLAS